MTEYLAVSRKQSADMPISKVYNYCLSVHYVYTTGQEGIKHAAWVSLEGPRWYFNELTTPFSGCQCQTCFVEGRSSPDQGAYKLLGLTVPRSLIPPVFNWVACAGLFVISISEFAGGRNEHQLSWVDYLNVKTETRYWNTVYRATIETRARQRASE